jgi:hypothetical protein
MNTSQIVDALLKQVDLERVAERFRDIGGNETSPARLAQELEGLVNDILKLPRGRWMCLGGVFVSLDEEGLCKTSFQKMIAHCGTEIKPELMYYVNGVELADWMVERLTAANAIAETGESNEWFDMDGKSYYLHRVKYDFETYITLDEVICTASVRIE